MPDVDSKLASKLRQAKQQPMFFAFIAKGTSEGVLLVSKKKVPIKEINEAKEESGGKKVFRGRCLGEDGKMVFELPKEPPSTLAKQLKAVIHESAGMMMQVEARVAPDLEGDEEEQEEQAETNGAIPPAPPPPAPPPPPTSAPPKTDLAAKFNAKLKTLAPVIAKLAGVTTYEAKEAKQAVTQANTLFRAKNYADALETLDIAEDLLKEALRASVNGAPPQQPANAAAAKRFATRLKALAPVLAKAEATGTEQADQAKAQIAQANKHYLAKEFDEANASLDQAEALMKQALVAAAQVQTNAPKAPPVDAGSAAFTARLKMLTPAYQNAAAASAEHKPTLDKLLAQAMASAKARKFEEGLAQLDELEAAIEAADSEADAGAELAGEFDQTLKSLQPRLARARELAQRNGASELGEFNTLLNTAMSQYQAEDFAKAYDSLTKLEAQVTAFLRNAKAQAEVRNAAGPDNVAFLASKQDWENARSAARAELAKFQAAVLNDAATKADPRYDDSIVPNVKGLDSVFKDLDDRINVVLDRIVTLPPEQKAASIQEALNIIGEYRQTVAGNQTIRLIDSGVYGNANIAGVFNTALDTMAKRMRKRLKAL